MLHLDALSSNEYNICGILHHIYHICDYISDVANNIPNAKYTTTKIINKKYLYRSFLSLWHIFIKISILNT